jgi:ABC-type phosphate/phosphonate transport system ATPase subunit
VASPAPQLAPLPSRAAPIIRAERVVKGYLPGVQALGGVSFSVRPGELVAVLGPSGAGKTTLFRCLIGLTRPDMGQVLIHGRDICRIAGREVRIARRDVALIFQQIYDRTISS